MNEFIEQLHDAYEEEKHFEFGVAYPFQSHITTNSGIGVMAEAHLHSYIEILFGLSGNADIYLNGRRYDFNVGDMLVINSKEVHSVVSKSTESLTSYIVVKFDPEVLYNTSATVFESKYVLPFILSQSTHQKLFLQYEIKDTFIPQLLEEIRLEFECKNYGFELAIRTNICRIFLWILRDWNSKGFDLNINYALNKSSIDRLQKVFDYVEANYATDISIAHMASLCNVSYSYFSRFFKDIMKKNFSEYLNYVRITASESLLTSTDLSITDIALNVGYSTSSYFIKQFRLFKNISPLKLRRTS
ncbi:MAG: AraC family transcriptional regulator [Bacillota bacterium]